MNFDIFAKKCRALIPEGITLLEHDGALPFHDGEKVALFGRGQYEYLKSGSGSGGSVPCAYVTNIIDELKTRVFVDELVDESVRAHITENPCNQGNGWYVPPYQKSSILEEGFVREAAERNEKAVYVLNRAYGEEFDSKPEKGYWYLTDEEEQNIQVLSKSFKHLIVLINSGNLMDMSWVKKYGVGTVAYVWQGGQEGGVGTVDALMGDVPPSGRLADTIAKNIEDYPCADCFGDGVENIHKEDIYVGYRYFETFAKDKVLYPFGYGLNYTEFEQTVVLSEKVGDKIKLSVRVKNVGEYRGKDVVQVYVSAPQGKLGKPARALIAFQKTAMLVPNEAQMIDLTIDIDSLASYDDSGKSGFAYAWVLEEGEYGIYVGENVRAAKLVFSFDEGRTRVVKQCVQALAPTKKFERMMANGDTVAWEQVPTANYDVRQRIKEKLPKALVITGDKGITLQDVAAGKNTLDEFVAQFDEKALMELVRGEGMSSPKAPLPGTASCIGGTTPAWQEKGVPVVTTCDGPCGIRLGKEFTATCLPTGSFLAATWLPDLMDDVFDEFADEAKAYDLDIILGCGMNIHRTPMCGRNFEYFSEDPYLAGKLAEKESERFTKKDIYCTLKHFAVNSQEHMRYFESEVLSERALREIFLKPFEIAVKSGYVQAIMTSYNRVNGISTGGNYDLTTTILRDDWGYDGFVMTDWWTRIDSSIDGSFEKNNLVDMVKAQNDVYMVVPDAEGFADDMKMAYESGYLTLGELQRCAKNILQVIMKSYSFKIGRKTKLYNLEAANELVFEGNLKKFGDGLEVFVPESAWYCAELQYTLNVGELEQKTLKIYVNDPVPHSVICHGTKGQVEKIRCRLYFTEHSWLWLDADGTDANDWAGVDMTMRILVYKLDE
ncbi:MAG: glycoside hydrolase family 3 protein [Clostridia bacterium]|nr:glycoside hydrolase family 3 protein [Clostridia bacterium]